MGDQAPLQTGRHALAFVDENTPLSSDADFSEVPTVFSFGYKGYGSGAVRFVKAVDDVERARGFEPPLWVDVRTSRKVRALGFKERAFERLVGLGRYRWLRDLGNEKVLDHGGGVKIRNPEAVAELLEAVLATRRRRVIFFCSCSGSLAECHRHTVGQLLLQHAAGQGVGIRLVEWPGGDPKTLTIELSSGSELQRETIDIHGADRETEAAAVAWGSHGILQAKGAAPRHVLLGPAVFGEKQTYLQIVGPLGPEELKDPMASAHQWRMAHGTEVMTIDSVLVGPSTGRRSTPTWSPAPDASLLSSSSAMPESDVDDRAMIARKALRPYQLQAVRDMRAAHSQFRRILVSLPTGTGKTLVAGHYLKTEFFDKGDTVLWIAHTEELLDQAYATLTRELGIPEYSVGRHFAGRTEETTKPDARIWLVNNTVISGPKRADLIVVDEAHHAAAVTYREWLSRYRAHTPKGARVLGLTATPYRLDDGEVKSLMSFGFSKPAVKIFEKTAFQRSFCQLAAEGYVAPFKRLRFETNLRFKVKLANTGDVSNESLRSLNTRQRNHFIHGVWEKQREQFGKTLIFVGTQDHARDLAAVFGADANYVISGDGSSRDERRQIIHEFRIGKAPVLINVGILKEGVDVPDIRTVILARPTASPVLYSQMVGRGSRVLPTKKFFYLVDIHDQLGEYERYMMGVEYLADRSDGDLIEVSRRAAAAERIERSPVKSLAEDPRALIDLLSSDSRHILTNFAGWIAFETPEGVPVPIAGLLDGHELTMLRGVADESGLLSPSRREDLVESIVGRPSDVFSRCLGALDEGLQGRILEFNQGRIEEDTAALDVLRADIGQNLPRGEGLAQMRSLAEHLQAWARSINLSESRTGSLIQDATVTSATYAGVMGLRDPKSEPFVRLLLPLEWKIVSSAIDRSRARTLTFADAPQIMTALNHFDPSWATHSDAVLDAILRAGRGEEVARAI